MSLSEDVFTRTLTSERLRAVYRVWRELAAGRMAPRRAEMTPAHLRRVLPWTFMVEVLDGGGDFRVRFRGDRLIQFMGDPCGATTLAGLRGTDFWDAVDALFRQCVENGKPLASGPKRTQLEGKEHLEREVLLLPLSEDGATVSGLLGAMDTWQLGTHRHSPTPVLAD